MNSVQHKLTKARTQLLTRSPFFASLALKLVMEPSTEIETAATDGSKLYYNEDFIKDLPLEKVIGLLAHETMHPALLHHTRRGSRDPAKWNKACDYAINSILKEAGFTLPSEGFIDSQYAGMTAEHIYSILPVEPGDNNSDKGNGDGGSNNDPGGDGGVMDSPSTPQGGGSKSQQSAEENQWKQDVAMAAQTAKRMGNLPGSLERLLSDLFEAKIPWRDKLHRFMTEKAQDDFSWRKGNRRFLAQDLYLPGRDSTNNMGEVVVVIDTSGSIGDKELTEFASEIDGIIAETSPERTYVIYCDCEVAHVDTFERGDDFTVTRDNIGGGGTCFIPPFEWLKERDITPRCLVYLTDGYGSFPDEQHFPVMWVINNFDVEPPHGEHLILDV